MLRSREEVSDYGPYDAVAAEPGAEAPTAEAATSAPIGQAAHPAAEAAPKAADEVRCALATAKWRHVLAVREDGALVRTLRSAHGPSAGPPSAVRGEPPSPHDYRFRACTSGVRSCQVGRRCSCAGRTRTGDLRLMRPPSCRCSTAHRVHVRVRPRAPSGAARSERRSSPTPTGHLRPSTTRARGTTPR